MINKSRYQQRQKVKTRISKKIRGSEQQPRLVVYRSLHHVYAQIIDDSRSATLASASSLSPDLREELKSVKGMKEIAKRVGKKVAERAVEKKISTVVFDRNGYIYHGIVKSLAEGAREGGLKF
jgi:large subunit ribosomal protein L18